MSAQEQFPGDPSVIEQASHRFEYALELVKRGPSYHLAMQWFKGGLQMLGVPGDWIAGEVAPVSTDAISLPPQSAVGLRDLAFTHVRAGLAQPTERQVLTEFERASQIFRCADFIAQQELQNVQVSADEQTRARLPHVISEAYVVRALVARAASGEQSRLGRHFVFHRFGRDGGFEWMGISLDDSFRMVQENLRAGDDGYYSTSNACNAARNVLVERGLRGLPSPELRAWRHEARDALAWTRQHDPANVAQSRLTSLRYRATLLHPAIARRSARSPQYI